MITEITWPVGKLIARVAQQEHSWSFIFSGGGSVVTESAWRLVTKRGIIVTSEDHGQRFGLKESVDAGAVVLSKLKEKKVLESQIVNGTSDLLLRFEDEARLEFLNLSSGFEAWRATHDSEDVICLGGGGLIQNEKKV